MASIRAALAAVALVLLVGGGVRAASPSPSASVAASPEPAGGGGLGNIQIWLDGPLPADAPAGSTIPIGMTVWDTSAGQLAEIGGLYFRLRPAHGTAKPASAETRSDWPGHIRVNVIVPKGGPGTIEVGVSGRSCTSDGQCTTTDFPFTVAGVGPPPEAARSRLVTAIVQVPTSQIPTGQPFDIGVTVSPRADWDPAGLGLPDRLVVVATLRDQPDLAGTELHADPSAPRAYHGSIAVPAAGDVALLFAFPGNGTEDDVIPEATTRVRVVGDALASPTAGPGGGSAAPATAGDGPPWLLIGGGLALLVVGGFVVSRAFADL